MQQQLNDQLIPSDPLKNPVKPLQGSESLKVKRLLLTENQLLSVAANFMSDLQKQHLIDIYSALIWYNDHLQGKPTGHINESKLSDLASIISMQGLTKPINPDDN